ncbi:MAG TPA: NAD-dependent epimerase/dehydratase family protein [Gemmatimonadales bacterium]|nr:NAD-dependent epimerase/dehydratase family protein [Gemmatimonadales bacterium]
MSDNLILVTGASGFLGHQTCEALLAGGATVRGLVRSGDGPAGIEQVRCDDLLDRPVMRRAVEGVGAIVHLAARVHVMSDEAADPLAEYRRTNVEGARVLMEEAQAAGVRRLILVSTVKAVAEESDTPLNEATPPRPSDPYGISKLEAERMVLELASSGTTTASVLRLPLVYGPGMKANMLRLFDAVDRGFPLPLGGVRNRRSVVFTGNVVTAIERLLATPAAAGEVFFVRDPADVSTPDLIRAIALALGRPARLLPVPAPLFRAAGAFGDFLAPWVKVPMSSAAVARLFGSLTVDAAKLARVTGFEASYSLAAGLRITAEWYRRRGAEELA